MTHYTFMPTVPISARSTVYALSLLLVPVVIGLTVCSGWAATFAARISPPNFELKGKPGQILREVISIENDDTENATYLIRTADWDLNSRGGVVIAPPEKPLDASSCRPWTRIERRTLKLGAQGSKRYRFEVHIPENAPDGECRFAIVIAPAPETVKPMKMGDLEIPIMGAIAVIVYVTVGDAQPDLRFETAAMRLKNLEPVPVIRFANRGNAHARPFGSIQVTDTLGKTAELIISPFPILPGRTWDLELAVDPEISGIQHLNELTLPFQLRGLVEWDGGTYRLDTLLKE